MLLKDLNDCSKILGLIINHDSTATSEWQLNNLLMKIIFVYFYDNRLRECLNKQTVSRGW